MKKRLTACMLAFFMILLVGCSSNTAKEAAKNETKTETSFPAGNTETQSQEETSTEQESTAIQEKHRIRLTKAEKLMKVRLSAMFSQNRRKKKVLKSRKQNRQSGQPHRLCPKSTRNNQKNQHPLHQSRLKSQKSRNPQSRQSRLLM